MKNPILTLACLALLQGSAYSTIIANNQTDINTTLSYGVSNKGTIEIKTLDIASNSEQALPVDEIEIAEWRKVGDVNGLANCTNVAGLTKGKIVLSGSKDKGFKCTPE